MAVCHTVILDEKKGQYTSASPDELALVYAAKQFGYEFMGMSSDQIIKITTPKGDKYYQLLNTCEFTSTRKRQSSIVKDLETEQIVLYCKGADNVIVERLFQPDKQQELLDKTNLFVEEFAKDGLRTLFLAKKNLEPKEYIKWNKQFQQAELVIHNREDAVAKVNNIIEEGLTLIGSTAIEDRLQDDVEDTIQFAKSAGIKVWVLTGDKIGTAINIGLSAGLLDHKDYMDIHIIREAEDHQKLVYEILQV